MVNLAFSWDDGASEDMKMLDLSLRYHIPGIFFIPATNDERNVISSTDIQTLAKADFEIGAHTYSHLYLTELSIENAEEEIVNGKDYLEQIVGRSIYHFCFPGGRYNFDLVRISKKYFISARTADTGAIVKYGSFLIKPTIHFYNRGIASLIYNGLKNKSQIFRLSLKHIFSSDYYRMVVNILEDLGKSKNPFNVIIWGHSWEIEKFGLWKNLEVMFKFLSDNDRIRIIKYSELTNNNISD